MAIIFDTQAELEEFCQTFELRTGQPQNLKMEIREIMSGMKESNFDAQNAAFQSQQELTEDDSDLLSTFAEEPVSLAS